VFVHCSITHLSISTNTYLSQTFQAANFLDIKPLLDLTCKAVAHLIRGKSNEDIRLLFGITTEFTKEEEDKVRKENPWCDDKA
jgi:S-phase kinase-associated protein 1